MKSIWRLYMYVYALSVISSSSFPKFAILIYVNWKNLERKNIQILGKIFLINFKNSCITTMVFIFFGQICLLLQRKSNMMIYCHSPHSTSFHKLYGFSYGYLYDQPALSSFCSMGFLIFFAKSINKIFLTTNLLTYIHTYTYIFVDAM